MIIFKGLSVEDIKKIADLQLAYLVKRVAERNVEISFTEKLKEMVAKEGYDAVYGARPLKRLIQKRVQDPLALLILKGEVKEGDKLKVSVDTKGNVTFK
jgi:ATP-dependent Clp protease ATP-binding subunit ClpB